MGSVKFGEFFMSDLRSQRGLPVAEKDYRNHSLWVILWVRIQLRVLGFGLLQDGDVGIGVFPEWREVWVTVLYGFDSCRRTTSDSE